MNNRSRYWNGPRSAFLITLSLVKTIVSFLSWPFFSWWTRGFTMRKPGACHHGRFMAYAIYILKIQLLSNCPNIGLTQAERQSVKRMANFIALCYTEVFLRSRIPTIAHTVDLKFRSLIEVYKKNTSQWPMK